LSYNLKTLILLPKNQIVATNAGFTLLELLIALALSTLLLLTLAIGVNLVLKDWERTDSYLDERLDKTLILLQIERALSAAFPHIYQNEKENKTYVFFEGKEDQIKWVSTVSPNRKYGLTAWQLLPSEEESGLEIRTVPAFTDDPTERLEETEQKTVVFQDYTVSFEYLYVEERKPDEGEWYDEWSAEETQGLPYAVRMSLESEKGQRQYQFEIIAPIFAHEHARIRARNPLNSN